MQKDISIDMEKKKSKASNIKSEEVIYEVNWKKISFNCNILKTVLLGLTEIPFRKDLDMTQIELPTPKFYRIYKRNMTFKKAKSHLNFEILSAGIEPINSGSMSKNNESSGKSGQNSGYRIKRKKTKPTIKSRYEVSKQEMNNESQDYDDNSKNNLAESFSKLNENSEAEDEMTMQENKLEVQPAVDPESLEKGLSRWVIPKDWKLVLYVKFSSNTLIETQDHFTFENYETVFNSFHKGYSIKGKQIFIKI